MPKKLIFCGSLMEKRNLLIDKESIWNPDKFDILSTNHQLIQPRPPVERQPRVVPKLPEIHVKCKVHKLFGQIANWQNVQRHSDRDGDAAVVWPHPLVVADHELVEDVGHVDGRAIHVLCACGYAAGLCRQQAHHQTIYNCRCWHCSF